ncbi:Pet127-domain-containing protein [Westerdykella ornata]|uniref:Pet127-domain-containing protein n=1 Tax=Westerdykella ornata TaxID=318751 RepID=A0A6A6JF83_WESOR|nr:Pet127-domain-containing protein [Westerdykella ornata]KAF2275211.1 Pet127-domain-containing protein [Westerdykella ornata]
MSLKEALLGAGTTSKTKKKKKGTPLEIEVLSPDHLHFQAIDHHIPPVPRLSYGLDRVLFNPGVYRLQDPRSRVYNFDPYLERIMPVAEFDFDALSEYKTSSKDPDLLALTRKLNTKFTGSTSSMSGVLQHFHFLLSSFRPLNHTMLSRKFPEPSPKFSKITTGPTAIFLRWKDGIYAIDADKSYDSPNIMSWLGHSLEKLLTTSREEFERFRRSSPEEAPAEDESGRCFHYSKLGNFLMRSQLDAHDSRLPGTGIFDLKTRAVVSIRMDHTEYETGSGYQLRYAQGEWESFEREFYDMTRATMLKYSLQVRMGRMDGIFVAYHNIERMFGFQYLSLPDMDNVLHGQTDTCLGDQEFKLSVALLDEMLQKATSQFPDTTLRLHFQTQEARPRNPPYLYIFAEPLSDEQADQIQNAKNEVYREFERTVIGVNRNDPDVQAEWQEIQDRVDEEVIDDERQGETEAADVQEGLEQEQSAPTESSTMSAHKGSDDVDGKDEESHEGSAQETSEVGGDQEGPTKDAPAAAVPRGPLMGWTLTTRNRVNGHYVERPEDLTPTDDWEVEYHIQEIPEASRWKLYDTMQKRREALLGQDRETQSKALSRYRGIIKKYSIAGREWREEQDRIDAEMGRRIFRPLGPGAHDILRYEAGLKEIEDGVKSVSEIVS